jgi:hypothetical protein
VLPHGLSLLLLGFVALDAACRLVSLLACRENRTGEEPECTA